ncbi:MAG: hypothetical protein KDC44_15535, partial [Phaeodactylibacter sp.]|nr:hypothetical protein [Phaeodactylibacter sp.]
MESNKLDKFFKDKLDQRPIEWDESYWASAQEALDVADQRKRRRGFLGWWMLLGFLILAGFGAWLLIYLPFGSTIVTKLENPSPVLENKTRSTAANPAEQVAEYSVAGNQALTQKEALVDSNTEIVEASSTVTTAAQDAEAHTISKDIPATAPLRETPETSKPAPIAPAGDSSVPSKSSQNSIQGASSTPITGQPSVVEQEMPSAATDSKETTEATPLPKTGQKTLPADYLPLLAYSVIWQATQPTLAIAVAEAKPGLETAVQPVQHKWHLGLSLNGGLALLQGAADRSILQKTLSGGVLIQRKLAGHWYLSSGLSYQASFAAYDSIAVVPQYEMSFGLDRNDVLLRPTIL